ncbi:hypothetical protein [Streptacidiphilus sp. EB129]|uniref:hypothetical protein n=1 Tax=Streptacidiphilus sp. EB129 TaxID=3156262 RepID=UPI003517F182
MTDPQLPAEHAGHAIRWEPWQTRAVCGRVMVPQDCRLCGQKTPYERTLGRVGDPGTVRASAARCTVCGGVQAFWREDPEPGETRGKRVPLCTGAHVHRIVSENPAVYGPCEDCGTPYEEQVFHCAGCGRRLASGQECTTPRCQEQAAVFAAELRAAYPEAFTDEETPA